MTSDPAGLYARLGVDPSASAEAITAAFRRKAHVLHPDVPETGNAEAFMQLMEAYDVLGDASQRAAYDRSARLVDPPLPIAPVMDEPAIPWPRFSDLPLGWWFGIGGLFVFAATMAVLQFSRPGPQAPATDVRPFAPTVPPIAVAPASVPASGAATHYVLPGGGAALLWRRGDAHDAFVPAGRVADFTAVQALGVLDDGGLVAVRLADGGTGFIDADRLAPGDRLTAHRAYCAYNAGAPPGNGEVLTRRGDGGARLAIENRGSEPAVVKLRDAAGRSVISIYVTAGASTMVTGLPDQTYRPDFALGELWSRACDSFTAGMRAQRFAGYASLAGLSPLVIPPNLSGASVPVDIPDQVFEQD
jgi:hypothetical protein